MVTKRTDPNYAQVTGHIPTELARMFGIYCAAEQISKSDGLERAIEALLEKQPEFSKSGQAKQPATIAEVVQQNYYALLKDGKIKPENLQAIAEGGEPSKADLSRLSSMVKSISQQELFAMRDRDFPQSQKRQEEN